MPEFKTIIEPFRIKTVEPIKMSTFGERLEYLKAAGYNPFLLDSNKVIIDLLTDSGTSAMSTNQWAGMMRGDESYAGASSWNHMRESIFNLTGHEYILPTHQGRAAERILYGAIGGKGKLFISNTHFDTTRANIEVTGAQAIDIPIAEGRRPEIYHPFKGNLDVNELKKQIEQYGASSISAVILTVTNNSGGGQPVSMQNAREVSEVCRKNNILLVLDCCRVAENSYFIKHREAGFENHSYYEIAQEMFRLCDASIMSAKKDALVNMGGFLTLRNKELADQCTSVLIITEGFATYGGLSGRDMEAISIGLKEGFEPDYLHYRIKSNSFLGEHLRKLGVPIIWPVGGHAVYVDAKAFYPSIPVHQYPGQALVCELYLAGGIRSVEIGSVMFGKYDENGKLIPAAMELVRLAVPRRVYTQSHIEYVIEVFENIVKHKKDIKGLEIIEEPRFLRHFTCKFKRL